MKGVFAILFIVLLCSFSLAIRDLPENYEDEITYALSKYPELEDVNIKFVEEKIATTMACRPNFNFIYKKKKNREYVITINNEISESSGFVLSDLSKDAQIGVIGHELAHIVDYEERNAIQILAIGIEHLVKRSQLEKYVDLIAINHGFGKGIANFTETIVHNKKTPMNYKKNKLNNYYSYSEVRDFSEFIDENGGTSLSK